MGRLHRHRLFLVALAIGILVTLASRLIVRGWQEQAILGADAFFLSYLILALRLALRQSPEGLRAAAVGSDEGLPLILILAVFIIMLSLATIFFVLNRDSGNDPRLVTVALAAVPLGWATLHLLAAHHYAGLFYRARPGGGDVGGIDFPGGREPGPWDFTYFAFVIGMTAQVSDATVTRTAMRKAVLAHSVVAFFYNTVILALAVNAALVFSGKG